ncbi:MAG: hypothetical protein IPF92_15730 [Myxococcales bacterium]|nr:hypothetical protein [Myxococcales bacterium]
MADGVAAGTYGTEVAPNPEHGGLRTGSKTSDGGAPISVFASNPPDEISGGSLVLEAFRTHHTTAELSATTDPNPVFDPRAEARRRGHYDDFEVDRVVEVVLSSPRREAKRAGGRG